MTCPMYTTLVTNWHERAAGHTNNMLKESS